MARNVEIKARVDDLDALESRVRQWADEGPIEINQDDTFFACSSGRLKVREFSGGAGQLIFYQRSDSSGPKESSYECVETDTPSALRHALGLAYGTAGRVIKKRRLYLIGRTRVHLDTVESLGEFVELEVVLEESESESDGSAVAQDLLGKLEVGAGDLIDVAYVDLLARNTGSANS